MSGWRLRLKQAPALRVDLRGITPTALAELSAAQIERLPLTYGNSRLPLAEFFSVEAGSQEGLVFEGELSRLDRIGWQMAGGLLRVEGSAGDYAGGGMTGGELHITGHAGVLAACEMGGGLLRIDGDAGDFAASTLPGSIDGMRGGCVVVRGNAGHRLGDRMRRGSVLVFGDVGDFLASRMVAGTVAVGGTAGAHAGYGMRRGSVVLAAGAGAADLSPSFVPAGAEAAVFWQLLARDLSRHGGPFEALPRRAIQRHLGDRGTGGKGELIFVD
jgi:formylmethanofuran dehydrogenase subunit C